MPDMLKEKIVKRGICLYCNSKEYEVVIAESNIRYGSGDYEDPQETAEDQHCLCYAIWYGSLADRGNFSAGGGVFLSLEEAVSNIEQENYFSHWI